jgi:hypothetical protein
MLRPTVKLGVDEAPRASSLVLCAKRGLKLTDACAGH